MANRLLDLVLYVNASVKLIWVKYVLVISAIISILGWFFPIPSNKNSRWVILSLMIFIYTVVVLLKAIDIAITRKSGHIVLKVWKHKSNIMLLLKESDILRVGHGIRVLRMDGQREELIGTGVITNIQGNGLLQARILICSQGCERTFEDLCVNEHKDLNAIKVLPEIINLAMEENLWKQLL